MQRFKFEMKNRTINALMAGKCPVKRTLANSVDTDQAPIGRLLRIYSVVVKKVHLCKKKKRENETNQTP